MLVIGIHSRDHIPAPGAGAMSRFGGISLREMARDCPVTEREMKNIGGAGTKKIEDFGEPSILNPAMGGKGTPNGR